MSQGAFSPPDLPKGLESLAELALDLRWTWSHEADHLWRALDPDTWEATAFVLVAVTLTGPFAASSKLATPTVITRPGPRQECAPTFGSRTFCAAW